MTTTYSSDYCTLAQLRDAIIRARTYTATAIAFDATTKTISDTRYGLRRFVTGPNADNPTRIQVTGTAHNDGYYTIAAGDVANAITVNESLVTEAAGPAVTITDVTDVEDDAALQLVIGAISRWADTYCGRRFYPVQETKYYTAEFPDHLKVDDLLTLTELACDISGNRSYDQAWDLTDYDLAPYNALQESPPRPYTRIERQPYGKYVFPIGMRVQAIYKTGIRKGVRVTGLFGYSNPIPPQVAQAVLLQCQRLFKRKDAIFGVMGSAEMGQQIVIPKFDPDVALLLQPFVKMSVGSI